MDRIPFFLLVLLVSSLALVTAFELFCYALRRYEVAGSEESSGLRRGALNVLGSLLAQCTANFACHAGRVLSPWWPFALRREANRPPVVLVHGYGGSRANLLWLSWQLRRRGFANVAGVGYPPLGGDVYAKARRLAEAVAAVLEASGEQQVDIVAHSMGGLVARAYIREYGGAGRVRRLVTLGSPHQGTRVAALGIDALARSMAPGSRLLTDLAREDPVPALVSVTSIFSTFDAKILPARNACYPGASNIEVDGIGHDAMLFSGKIATLVVEALEPAVDRRSPSSL